MKVNIVTKESFSVIGKLGQGLSSKGFEWIPPLWQEANSKFDEIRKLAKIDSTGNILGIWGAMSDIDDKFERWKEQGKYLAGCEVVDSAVPSINWTKWVIPSYKYAVIKCTQDKYGDIFNTFPLLITGNVNDESLKAIAQAAYIDIDDRSSVISIEDSIKYQNIISKITEACSSYFFYSNNINIIIDLLKSTIVGKQGVPIENMMMNFWRYLRRATAIKLYENGFLTDSIPSNGNITVFYENDIKYF